MPEIDLAIHSSILIEESFKRNYDEENEVAVTERDGVS
jgi:hypothetical protein